MRDRTILLFEASVTEANRRAYSGVYRYAKEAHWNVHSVEYSIAADKRRHASPDRPAVISEIVNLWHPCGVIVECAGRAPVLARSAFGRLPVVFLDCHPSFVGKNLPCVYSDARSIAKCAVRELALSDLTDMAYLPYIEPTVWSRERGEVFRDLVNRSGLHFHNLALSGRLRTAARIVEELAHKLAALPHPCGLFAANDEMARYAASACERAGLSVPDDIAVIGVDNDEDVCENAEISLSSVQVDYDACGYTAAMTLDRLISASRRPPASVAVESTMIERRQSTRRCERADYRVTAALEYIRRNACSGIAPQDVVLRMGCSRRLADLRFAELVHHTILDEIHDVRIDRAKKLLTQPDRAIASIPNFCGYRNLADLCRDFKKRTGTTLRAWRARA